MSLVTLKKKTNTQYRNMSSNRIGGFSLNGSRRSQGYIGQSMVSRHFPSTPMRGNVARGHGGCCGTYKIGTIIQTPSIPFPTNPSNGSTASNKSNVIKSSVLDTKGMLMTKYRWIRRPQPYATVKPDSNMIQGTQHSYIENLAKNTVTTLNACNTVGKCKLFANTCGNLQRYQRPRPFGTNIVVTRGWYSTTKTSEALAKLGPIDQSSFIKALAGSCSKDNVMPISRGYRPPLPGPPTSY